MIVELFGLPGSGKSHFATTVASQHGWSRVELSSKVVILKYFLGGVCSRPGTYLRGLLVCLRYSWRPFYLWNFYVIRYAKYHKASRSRDVVILDEGPLQNIVSYPSTELTTTTLEGLIQTAPAADLVLFFAVSETKRAQNLATRPYTSWREQEQHKTGWDHIMQSNVQRTRALLSGRDSCYFVHDATTAEEIVTTITSYANNQKPA